MTFRRVNKQLVRFQRAAAILVIIAITGYGAAYLTGLHTHLLPDGRVIVHSHHTPKTEGASGHHQHSAEEYAIFNAIGNLIKSGNITIFDIPAIYQTIPFFLTIFSEDAPPCLTTGAIKSRAPPS